MTNRAIQLFNQLRPVTVGFDNAFDHFERMFEDDFMTTIPAFPHYNIVKKAENKYDIEIALAGYNKKDIEVELKEGVLTIKSKKDKEEDTKDGEVIHKGIAKRYFSKAFTIADDVEVKGAELKDGLLKVSMERIVPEHRKAKTIDIK
tara:strand:+ start:198 stop:638 length:441 start_codon:yes stop_codon:yes gene_type:complete